MSAQRVMEDVQRKLESVKRELGEGKVKPPVKLDALVKKFAGRIETTYGSEGFFLVSFPTDTDRADFKYAAKGSFEISPFKDKGYYLLAKPK